MNLNPNLNPNPNDEYPVYGVTDRKVWYPAGNYLFAIGSLNKVFVAGTIDEIEAVTLDLWVLQLIDTKEWRVTIENGKVVMPSHRGAKIVERFPRPDLMPQLAWRAGAFFSPLQCIKVEVTGFDALGKEKVRKIVDWGKVQESYGKMFTAEIAYSAAKGDRSKRYRNFIYDTISLTSMSISPEQMRAIEEMYNLLAAQEESDQSTFSEPQKADDLPF